MVYAFGIFYTAYYLLLKEVYHCCLVEKDGCIYEVNKQGTYQRHYHVSRRSRAVLAGDSLHVRHSVRRSAHTEAAEAARHNSRIIALAQYV